MSARYVALAELKLPEDEFLELDADGADVAHLLRELQEAISAKLIDVEHTAYLAWEAERFLQALANRTSTLSKLVSLARAES